MKAPARKADRPEAAVAETLSATAVSPLPSVPRRDGFTIVEIVVVVALLAILTAVGMPAIAQVSRSLRLEMAAAELASSLRMARAYALRRGVNVALHFRLTAGGGLRFTMYRDGDGDGVRGSDIELGVDPIEQPTRLLGSLGRGVGPGFPAGIVPRDPSSGRRLDRLDDPIRFNRSDLASFSALGTATPGTVYLTDGASGLVAVRITSLAGRVRTMRYDADAEVWKLL